MCIEIYVLRVTSRSVSLRRPIVAYDKAGFKRRRDHPTRSEIWRLWSEVGSRVRSLKYRRRLKARVGVTKGGTRGIRDARRAGSRARCKIREQNRRARGWPSPWPWVTRRITAANGASPRAEIIAFSWPPFKHRRRLTPRRRRRDYCDTPGWPTSRRGKSRSRREEGESSGRSRLLPIYHLQRRDRQFWSPRQITTDNFSRKISYNTAKKSRLKLTNFTFLKMQLRARITTNVCYSIFL